MRGDGRWHLECVEPAIVTFNRARGLVARQRLVLAARPLRSTGVEERATMRDRRVGSRLEGRVRSVLGGGEEDPSLRGERVRCHRRECR